MKKSVFSILMMALVLCLGLTSCGGGDNPGKAVEKYYRAAADGNVDVLLSLMDFTGFDAETKKMMEDGMKESFKNAKEAEAKVKSFEIIKEEISADGKTATVEFKMVGSEKGKEDETINQKHTLVKTNEGWKIKMDF